MKPAERARVVFESSVSPYSDSTPVVYPLGGDVG